MDIETARHFYNCSGVDPRTDPECVESRFAVDRFRPQLERTITPGLRLLDLGCNAGRFVFAAEELGAVPVGIDCATIPLAHARQVAERRGSCATFIQGDYTALSFAPASFDIALLINNIVECSYDDFAALLRQLHTILTPDGLFCLSMPDYLAQHQERGRSLLDFDPSTGKQVTTCDFPEHGTVPYHAYFWTAAFAKHLCARYLVLQEEERLAGGYCWFVFRNGY